MTDEQHKKSPTAPVHRQRLRIEIAPMTFIIAVLTGAAAWTLLHLLPALLVLLVALMIVGTLNPAVRWLGKRGIGRGVGIAIVFGVLLLLVFATATLTVPALIAQVSSLIQQEPALRAHLVKFLAS